MSLLAAPAPRTKVAALATSVTGLYAVAGGLVTLLGWFAKLPRLTDWEGDGISMFANTALAATCTGLALLFLARPPSRGSTLVSTILGAAVALLGAATLLEHVFRIDLGIDTLLVHPTWGERAAAALGRMGPPASLSFALLGSALCLAGGRRRSRKVAAMLTLVVTAIATLALTGYLFDAEALYTKAGLTGIALQSATMILALAIGLLAALPDQEPARTLLDQGAAGALARRAFPFILLMPVMLGWLRVLGQRAGLFDTALGTAILVIVLMAFLCAALWWGFAAVRAKEAALQESEVRFRTLAEASPAVIWFIDPDGRCRYVNRPYLEFFGRSEEEVLSSDWRLLVHPDDEASFTAEVRAALRERRPLRVRGRVRRYDGEWRWTQSHGLPLFGAGGMYLGHVGHSPDITDIVLAQRALQESEEQFRRAIEAAPVPVIMHAEDGQILQISRAWTELTGYTLADAPLLQSWLTSAYGGGWHQRPAAMRTIFADGARSLPPTDLAIITRSGEHRVWTYSAASAGTLSDGRRFIVGMAQDLTERTKIEADREQLLASERSARAEAERATQLKDEFLATLSHELRTPLNAILGWTHLAKKEVANPERVGQAIGIIDRNARLQAQLIADLLDMSRIITGKMRLDVQRVDLPVVLDAAIEAIKPAAEARGVRLQKVIEPVGDPVWGDPARLQQIVWNLLSNAVKFTPRGGRVQVLLARVNSHIEIAVSDTGEGIDAGFLPYIFERFRQGDASASRHHGGLGIGLALVKQLVELHGGKVSAASEGKGKGATFVIDLPLAILYEKESARRYHPRALASSASECKPPDLTGTAVLLVDDEPDALEMARRVLTECGAEVLTAGGASEALSLLDRRSFDIVVSDIGMPTMDGYAFVTELRRRGVTIPAAALTAFARSEDRTKAMLSGYQGYVTKPVEPVELLATVAALTRKTARPRE